jgi:hypothetical protein
MVNLMSHQSDPDFDRHEADLLAEEVGGAPARYRNTADAIKTLTERIIHLEQRMEAAHPDANLRQLRTDLARAKLDLAHYHALAAQAN